MKNNKYLRAAALLCICMVLMFTGIKAREFFEENRTDVSINVKESISVQEKFDQYLNDLFCQEVAASTINLHYTLKNPEEYGITKYTVSYGTISDESQNKAVAVLENIKAALNKIDPDKLDRNYQMTYDILTSYVEHELHGANYYLYQEMLRPSTGTQAEIPVLMAEYTFYDEQDVQDYLELLNQMPAYFGQILNFEKQKAEAGLFMSDYAADDIILQCENFISDKENNYLLDTFNDKLAVMEAISAEQKAVYQEENKSAVLDKVIPAYENLINGMQSLKGQGKNQAGLFHFEQGREYYEYLVKAYTGSDMSVEEMKKKTKEQRAEDMSNAAKLIGENPELLVQCTTYTFEEKEPDIILEELQEKMVNDFPTPPDTSFAIKYVHPSLEKYLAPAFYLTVPIDDISRNAIYINGSSNYQKIKLYTTLAHEGFPGHLYQNIMERSQNFPAIRSLLGTSGYAEGWATYVEMISYYYADIDEPLAALLQRDQSALLSLYATADIGIHYDGWGLDETKDFFAEYQITNEEAVTDIFHLIVEEPAHYLKYYIGYLEFLNLKEYTKKTYGEEYSDYKFHEALLKMGPGWFPVLKKYITQYYNNAA